MKQSPQSARLNRALRPSKISGAGFLGSDPRPVEDIVAADAAELARLGRAPEEIAARMREITAAARAGLGTSVTIGPRVEALADDARGLIICPFGHPGRYSKTVTTATHTGTGRSVVWSDLSIHLIEAHAFFEGRGSPFRLEPAALVDVLFPGA